MKNKILTVLACTLLLFSCNNVLAEFKSDCETYNIYYLRIAKCYVFVPKNASIAYYIFDNQGTFYVKAEMGLGGNLLYYGEGYPSVDAALEASVVKNRGERIRLSQWDDAASQRDIICEEK